MFPFVIPYETILIDPRLRVATMITPGLIPLSEKFGVSGDVASSFMIGAVGFWTALGSFFVVSGASIWGRRPFYVLSIVFLAISNYLAYLAEVREVRLEPWESVSTSVSKIANLIHPDFPGLGCHADDYGLCLGTFSFACHGDDIRCFLRPRARYRHCSLDRPT